MRQRATRAILGLCSNDESYPGASRSVGADSSEKGAEPVDRAPYKCQS